MLIAGFTAEGLQRYVEKVMKIGLLLLHEWDIKATAAFAVTEFSALRWRNRDRQNAF